jgi:hypothetical protein
MSKRINVNPDHYKVAGRERPGNAATKDPKEPTSAPEQARAERWRTRQQDRAGRRPPSR